MMGVPAVQGGTIASLIKSNRRQIEAVLPKNMDVDRMSMLALAEARKNPDLLKADPTSFIGALIQAAQLGLEPGAAGLGYLIPRWNSRLKCHEVQFQAGYRGLLKLARNSGEVGAITASVVCEGDEFTYALGTEPHLTHRPSIGERGEVTHVYAVAHLFKSGDWQFEVMTYMEIEQIRARAKAKSGPWVTDWPEMAKKTVARRLSKWLPLSATALSSIAAEESAEADGGGSRVFAPEELEIPTVPASPEKPKTLADKFEGADPVEADVEPVSEPDDWELMEWTELVMAVERLAKGKTKFVKTLKDAVERGDQTAIIELARTLSG